LPEGYWAPFRQSAVDRWNCRPASAGGGEASSDIRAALEQLVAAYAECDGKYEEYWPEYLDGPMAAARAALAAEPAGEGPSDEELLAMRSW
jgi:hypothetical protein